MIKPNPLDPQKYTYFVDAIQEFKKVEEELLGSLTLTGKKRVLSKNRAKMYEIIGYSIFLAAIDTKQKYMKSSSGIDYYDLPLGKTYAEEVEKATKEVIKAVKRMRSGESIEKIRLEYKNRTLKDYRDMGFDLKDQLSRREIRKLEDKRLFNLSLLACVETKNGAEEVGRNVYETLSSDGYLEGHEKFLQELESLPADEESLVKKDYEARKRLIKEDSVIEDVVRRVL